MSKITKLVALLLLPSAAIAAPLSDFTFKSPSFNGIGYSSHVLTIENQERTRQKEREDKLQAEIDKAVAAKSSTNIAKFMSNLESRIYAQVSQNLATSMFANGQCKTATDPCNGSFVMDYVKNTDGSFKLDADGKKIPFTAIEWTKSTDPNSFNDAIKLTVTQGGDSTSIWVPLNSFAMPTTNIGP